MAVACGIVGLPNVGKSTLFNALTRAGAASANYPFCTIEPNTGVVDVPDARLEALAAIVQPERILPASQEFVDIAGLVRGASKGEGLGNAFLANIRDTDAIIQVCRCFEDSNITHVEGSVDPARDIEIIETELMLKDLETTEKALSKASKLAKGGDKEAIAQTETLTMILAQLNQSRWASGLSLSKEALSSVKSLGLLTLKPVLFVGNISESDISNPSANPHFAKLEALAEARKAPVLALCSKLEAEIQELDSAERPLFLEEAGLKEPGLDALIRSSFNLLGLHTYFTAGVKEVRAWTIPKGATAPQAAGVIHTDFEKGFIRAQTIAYQDYIACHGEQGAKDSGKVRTEGKDYVVGDGDVMHFLFNI